MTSTKPTTAMLHYTAPPVVGGVEAVIDAHARVFLQMDYPVSIIAGQGSEDSLPLASEYLFIPALDSQHRDILAAGAILEQGRVPQDFAALTKQLTEALAAQVSRFDNLIVHNVFTKHFNLPLTLIFLIAVPYETASPGTTISPGPAPDPGRKFMPAIPGTCYGLTGRM
jgi:hypothetical protein